MKRSDALRSMLLAAALATALAGCGGSGGESGGTQLAVQHLGAVEVNVETRPSPPVYGMNEVLVMLSTARGRPVSDVVVSVRGNGDDQWRQAIQDGLVGVYRRAIRISPGSGPQVVVKIEHDGRVDELVFPLPPVQQ